MKISILPKKNLRVIPILKVIQNRMIYAIIISKDVVEAVVEAVVKAALKVVVADEVMVVATFQITAHLLVGAEFVVTIIDLYLKANTSLMQVEDYK